MNPSHSPTLTQSDIARVALKRLAELGLPPTPDNYSKFYNAIATIKSPVNKPESELKSAYQVLFQLSDLLDGVNDTAEQLISDLQRGGENMSQSLEALKATEDGAALQLLLAEIIDSTDFVYETVNASHRDLQDLKTSMTKMQSELAVNRKIMEQDPLTGALNRQGLENGLVKEVKRARRAHKPITVVVLSLSSQRQFVDQYGHLLGDKLLTHFASVAKAVLRESDQLVRYGNEEFMLLLPETDLHGARFLVDRLRQVNVKTPFVLQQKRIEIAFCAGIAQLQAEENGHAMLLRADEAMAKARAPGADPVQLAD